MRLTEERRNFQKFFCIVHPIGEIPRSSARHTHSFSVRQSAWNENNRIPRDKP